jgi:hypothetical protein
MDAESAEADRRSTMTTEPPIDRRVGLAIVTASAAVTLAIGVTAGTLLGWVHPPRPVAEPSTTSAAVTDGQPAPESPRAIQAPVEPAAIPSPVRVRRRAVTRPTRTLLADARARAPRLRHHEDERHDDEGHEDENDD